jgi:hypothetical protein
MTDDLPWQNALESTLTSLETALCLVDHINPALTTNQTVVAMARAQGFQ